MNTGAFGENFPYSNFHELNMDWIIKIAKDFLDQYSHIQQVIQTGLDDLSESRETGLEELSESRETGLEELNQKTLDGLAVLQEKYNTLDSLLQAWYNTHSTEIANQLTTAIADFNSAAEVKSQELLDSWPEDYSALLVGYNNLKSSFEEFKKATVQGYNTFDVNANFLTEMAGYVSSDGSFVESAAYTSFYFTIKETNKLYVDSGPQNYFSVGLYRGAISSETYLGRYRLQDSNLPTEQNPLILTPNTIVVFSMTSQLAHGTWFFYSDITEYGYTLNSNVLLSESQIKEVFEKQCYLSVSDEVISIYLPKMKLIFKPVSDNTIHLNTFRLYSGYIRNGETLYKMWEASDAEGVVKLVNEADFIGGYHGDETYTQLKMIIDGHEIGMSNRPKTYFNNFTIVVKSKVYHCDSNIEAFDRVKKLIFTPKGMEIRNYWTALGNFTIQFADLEISQCNYSDSESGGNMLYISDNTTLELRAINNEYPVDIKFTGCKYYTNKGVVVTEVLKTDKILNRSYFQNFTNRVKTYFHSYQNEQIETGDVLVGAFQLNVE